MPNRENRQDTDFAKFDAMSTEELQQILREDASKPEGEGSDMETLLYVMEVLAKRRKEQNEGKSPEEALDSFKRKYYKPNDHSFVSERVNLGQNKCIQVWWSRGLIAAAVALVLIISSSFTASAMGFDLFEVIAKWTQETFHFAYAGQTNNTGEPNPNYNNPCESLQAALNRFEYGIAIVPTWLPEDYIEVELKIDETPIQRRFYAKYQSGENTIRIRIVDYLNGAPSQVEQDESLIELYPHNGVNYYIFNNYDQLRVTWVVDSLECVITGPLTVTEIKEIINSIE